MSEYWKKWKETLSSLKESEFINSLERRKKESIARIEMLKKRFPEIEFPTLKTPEFEEKPTEKLTLRERYGFKKINYS